MPVVPDPELEERAVSVRSPVEVHVELDREAPVLAPVGEHLFGELVRRRLQRRLSRFVLVAREVCEVHVRELHQGQGGALARSQRGRAPGLQAGNRDPPRHHAVLVEEKERREEALDGLPDRGPGGAALGRGWRMVGRPARPPLGRGQLREQRVRPLDLLPGRTAEPVPVLVLVAFASGPGVPFFGAVELDDELVLVRPGRGHEPRAEHVLAMGLLDRAEIIVVELEGGGDRAGRRYPVAVPSELAARVIAQGDERVRMSGRDRVQAVQGPGAARTCRSRSCRRDTSSHRRAQPRPSIGRSCISGPGTT